MDDHFYGFFYAVNNDDRWLLETAFTIMVLVLWLNYNCNLL